MTPPPPPGHGLAVMLQIVCLMPLTASSIPWPIVPLYLGPDVMGHSFTQTTWACTEIISSNVRTSPSHNPKCTCIYIIH